MAWNTRKITQKRQWSTKLVIALLAILTAVVIGLVVVALKSGSSTAPQGLPTSDGPKPTASAEPTPDTSEEPAPETEEPEEPVAAPAISATVPDRIITAVTNSVLVRATAGTCEQAGVLEISDNGGQSWSEATALAATNSTKHLRVIPTRANMIQLVSLDDDCQPQLSRTQDLGASWLEPIAPDGAWFFNPDTPTIIYAPDEQVDAPCAAVSLVASADNAAVLCADSTIITTNDRAATWKAPVAVPGAVAINLSGNDYIVAIANQNECAGLQTIELKGPTLGSPSSCLEAELQERTISVARTANSVYAWFGNQFATSADGGNTWQ